MRCIFLTPVLIIALWIAGCNRDRPAEAGIDLKPAANSAMPSDTDGGAVQNPAVAADTALEMEGQYINQIDTVRPAATKKSDPVVPVPQFPPPSAAEMVRIPAGQFLHGSAPQDTLRDQFAENDNESTTMTAFQMDVLPWPNDPAAAFLTGVAKPDAEAMCASQGKRLCTKLEIEWACRGSDNRRYPIGNTYDEAAWEDPVGPASPFGVYGFGKLIEWTSSAWGEAVDQVERVAVRGFVEGSDLAGVPVPAKNGRRCAKRWHRPSTGGFPEVGFRCCKGPANRATCTIEPPRPAHSLYTNMKPDKFAQVIRSIPELSMIHDNPHMFSDGDVRTVLARRSHNREELSRDGIHFRWKPLRWIPRQGTELWVAVGRSNRHGFVVALHETKDNEEYVLASSLIIWDNPAPIALAYREGHRDQVFWAPCWGCRDGGTIEWDDAKNEVIITHRW